MSVRERVSVHDNVNCVVSSVGVVGVSCGVPSGIVHQNFLGTKSAVFSIIRVRK